MFSNACGKEPGCQSVILSEISGVLVALDATFVREIRKGAVAPSDQKLRIYDLAEVMGLPYSSGELSRGTVLLSGPVGAVGIVLGSTIALESLETREVLPVPPIVEQACQRYGCVGLLQEENGFRLVLDPLVFINQMTDEANA